MEVLHEKVTKQIIKEGHGQKPSKYATCFLHYRAWTESTQHKFEDTWQEQQPLELVIGKEKKEMTGLAIGISGMRSGERKARSDMTVEERIGAADRRKMNGNALFKEEKLEEAMQQYEMAIAYMGDDFMFQLFGKYRDMALAVKNPCHLNMAACLLKLNRYDEAIAQCSIVLVEDENNVKALFRRGKARAELGQTDAAREDFLKARKFAPQDKAISQELRLLAEHDKAVYQKQKELYKGLFGKSPEPKPEKKSLLLVIWHWLLSLFYYLFRRKAGKTD
nr:peptidyl-prolyl cis-trans isomerase FKBP42 [Ipomoea batatas]